jgi:DNA-directed RNA polymerase specialized sigma24 family protein
MKNHEQYAGHTEPELIRWLQTILHNAFREWIRRERAQGRDPEMEASLDAAFGLVDAARPRTGRRAVLPLRTGRAP